MRNELSPYGIIPKGTDGVSCGGHSHRQSYSFELQLRNAADLAEWLLDYGLTPEQHKNILSMLNSKDLESKYLALEIIKIKKQKLWKFNSPPQTIHIQPKETHQKNG